MPFYVRAKTYLRYAEEEYRKGLARLSERPEEALSVLKDSFVLAAKAIWALAQVEAPKEKPDPEKLMAELSRAAEAEIADFFQKGWQRFKEGVSPEEARFLAQKALQYAREILAPLLGPSAWSPVS